MKKWKSSCNYSYKKNCRRFNNISLWKRNKGEISTFRYWNIKKSRNNKRFKKGDFDCLVGINLLREGLDLPEVTLVAILDADKEGFLRSHTSLIQTIGRAARNVNGKVIMYADEVTESMKKAIDETNRRRKAQIGFNEEHGIKPESIRKAVKVLIDIPYKEKEEIAEFVKESETYE